MTWLGHPDGGLGALEPQPIARRIAQICNRLGAQRLFATSPLDLHEDHKATARIAELACRLCVDLQLFHLPHLVALEQSGGGGRAWRARPASGVISPHASAYWLAGAADIVDVRRALAGQGD